MARSTVTYSPEDNKLRLYVGRVPRDEYERLRAAGFISTPKQDCDFVTTWTPRREDLAREYLEDDEDVGDEDYSPEERAADRAERFSGYRDKRAAEAGVSADTFEAGPAAFGHQSQARAERQARRHDRHRTYAVSQWSKAEYWQERTASVIAHALHRSSPAVRRGRILTLEAEQRKHLNELAEAVKRWETWQKIAACDDPAKQTEFATRYAGNLGSSGLDYQHPRRPEQRKTSLYSLLTDPQDPITGAEACAMWLDGRHPDGPAHEGGYYDRWAKHFELRLTYERAMLAADGGTVTTAEIEPGGWIRPSQRDRQIGRAHTNAEGWSQVLRVFKSPATGRVTSVQVMGDDRYLNDPKVKPRTINVERLGEDAYRPPTDEERAKFTEAQNQQKAAAKASKPKAVPIINPTDEDAEKLQGLWNAAEKASHDSSEMRRYGRIYTEYKPSTVRRMTQAQYSDASKGAYAHCTTAVVSERLTKSGRVEVFKIRRCHSDGMTYGADRVIVLTDKPRAAIPWQAVEEAKAKQPSAEKLFPRMAEIDALTRLSWRVDESDREGWALWCDATYAGLVESRSMSQFGFTDFGRQKWAEYQQIIADGGTPGEHGTTYSLSAVAAARSASQPVTA